ncbi:hypothetical protein [Burkholderia ubonensis]|uniref:hypothetical protein n=1 Tax=Burkholderia ubonensis TaxID=101571 RepID=UPI000AC952F0|nr:hypothetical protein [Burkholderia ubonensis]
MRVLLKLWAGATVMVLCVAWLAHRPAHGQSLLSARPVQRPAQMIIEQARQPQLAAGALKVLIQMSMIETCTIDSKPTRRFKPGSRHPAVAG